MASGWESEGPGFKQWGLQAAFDPRLPKKIQQKYSQPYSMPLIIDFARCTLKKIFVKKNIGPNLKLLS